MSKKMLYNEFLNKAKTIHGDKYIYDDETEKCFNGSHSVIPIICPKHGKFLVEARNHLKYDCKKCSYEKRALKFRSNSKEFEEKARKVHGDKYIYTDTYKTAKKDKVCIICPIHGEFWQTPNDHLSGKGCHMCNDSHLERELLSFLEVNNIKYERRKHFDWLGKQEVDFYLTEYNVGIECQGKQHIGLGGWSEKYDFERQYELDKRKNELSNENGVLLLYYIEKTFYNKALEYEIYNESNSFYDLETIKENIR